MKVVIEAPSLEAVAAVAEEHGWVLKTKVGKNGKPKPAPASLSIKDAAAGFGVHIDTMRRWIDEGKVASYRTPGGHRRVPVDALPQQ